MSGWVDVVAAKRTDANRIAKSRDVQKEFGPGAEFKYLPPGTWVGLFPAFSATDAGKESEFEELEMDLDEGGWVFALPERLINSFVGLSPDDVAGVAARWHASGGVIGSIEQTAEFLTKVCNVARKAQKEKKLVLVRHQMDG